MTKETTLIALVQASRGEIMIWLDGAGSENGWKVDPRKLLDALDGFWSGLKAGQFIPENEVENEIEGQLALVSLVQRKNGEIVVCTSKRGREKDPEELRKALEYVVATLRRGVVTPEELIDAWSLYYMGNTQVNAFHVLMKQAVGFLSKGDRREAKRDFKKALKLIDDNDPDARSIPADFIAGVRKSCEAN